MYVILPKNSNPEKLRAAQKILTAEKIEKMISQMVLKTTILLFPKMHMHCGHHLKSALQELGLQTLFEPYASDLSVLSDGSDSSSSWPQPQDSFVSKNQQQSSSYNINDQLLFGRLGNTDEVKKITKREVTYKTASDNKNGSPLSIKDFMVRKRIVKKTPGKKHHRSKRQYMPFAAERLDMIRNRKDLKNPHLFADEVIHKVDLTINEKGTEGGAATAVTLNRTGPQVLMRVEAPFMFLIRHDPTRVAIFYGVVFEPQNL